MADNFFGFNTELPNVLGHKNSGDELLTADVEDEFDALNDETFGSANNDDWEEAHEKLTELIKKNNFGRDSFFDSHLDNDASQNEIVSNSISQLGLEDDLDDPAIMTFSHSSSTRNIRPFNSSPPPPAILETEICGSPKTYSIWSTTPKDSGISSFLQSIGHKSSSFSPDTSTPLKHVTDSVFATPPKAWRAEELERDLLSTSNKVQTPTTTDSWTSMSKSVSQDISPIPSLHTEDESQNKVISPRLHSNLMPYPTTQSVEFFQPPMNVLNGYSHPFAPNFPPVRHPTLGKTGVPVVWSGASPYNFPMVRPGMPNLPPGFNTANINSHPAQFMNLPPRIIHHPFFYKQSLHPTSMVDYKKIYGNENNLHDIDSNEDEYAGLMTQREREWLIRIQLLQLKSENPYVEDYYYTTQVARRCQKKFSENTSNNSSDAPELILPETTKHENRAFVPIQFEGSLGKLQAVSVNFPRKILDITVTRSLEDEEGKAVTNQSLMKYRRLLIDIEKLYGSFLEIEDEERRILAKPDSEKGPHVENIIKLKKNIFTGLCCDGSSEDNFLNFMSVRKGRSLFMRIFKLFNLEQQLSCLSILLHYLPYILKKDQNDNILTQNVKLITDAIQRLSMSNLIRIVEVLDSDTSIISKGKECSTFLSSFKHKFSSTVICTIIVQADKLFNSSSLHQALQTKWTSLIMKIANCLCSLPISSVCAPLTINLNLTIHFRRFLTNKDQLEKIQERLNILNTDTKNDRNV